MWRAALCEDAVSPFLDPVDDGARQEVDTEPEEEVDTEHTEEQKASDAPPPPENAPGDVGSVEPARSGHVTPSSERTVFFQQDGDSQTQVMAVAPAKAVAPTKAGESGTDVEPGSTARRPSGGQVDAGSTHQSAIDCEGSQEEIDYAASKAAAQGQHSEVDLRGVEEPTQVEL